MVDVLLFRSADHGGTEIDADKTVADRGRRLPRQASATPKIKAASPSKNWNRERKRCCTRVTAGTGGGLPRCFAVTWMGEISRRSSEREGKRETENRNKEHPRGHELPKVPKTTDVNLYAGAPWDCKQVGAHSVQHASHVSPNKTWQFD